MRILSSRKGARRLPISELNHWNIGLWIDVEQNRPGAVVETPAIYVPTSDAMACGGVLAFTLSPTRLSFQPQLVKGFPGPSARVEVDDNVPTRKHRQ